VGLFYLPEGGGNCQPAAAEWRGQNGCGQALRAKAAVGLEARTVWQPFGISRGICSHIVPAVKNRREVRWVSCYLIFEIRSRE
jgi:hypothetical protein